MTYNVPVTFTLAVTGDFVDKVDLKRKLNSFYKPSAKDVVEVHVPAFNFLMIDGEGNPNASRSYKEAVEALFSVSYAAKFATKKEKQTDFVVMPLEGLWWADDMSTFQRRDKGQWKWTMMIMQPGAVTKGVIDDAVEGVRSKKSLPGLDKLRFERFEEGRSAQILHVGPFDAEGPTIQRVHDFIADRSALRGKHHEIYLSDIRRATPENWKTVVRQPME